MIRRHGGEAHHLHISAITMGRHDGLVTPHPTSQGEADSRGLEGRGARLQLRAGRTASTRLQRALHPLPAVSPLAELFAVLSSTLGFKQDTAGSWSKCDRHAQKSCRARVRVRVRVKVRVRVLRVGRSVASASH